MPTFVEAPSDVTAKEGETVKMPCRAQGRPRVRVVWDRVGRFTHEEPKISFSTRNDLLSNTKLLPLRTKRNDNETNANASQTRIKREIDGLHIINLHSDAQSFDDEFERHKRVLVEDDTVSLLDEFEQIMRDKSDINADVATTGKMFRRKRTKEEIEEILREQQKMNNGGRRTKRDVNGVAGTESSLHFSTPSTFSNYLEINENGDLLLRDVTHNDQV